MSLLLLTTFIGCDKNEKDVLWTKICID